MKNTHENKTMFWTAIFSTIISVFVIVFGIWYGNKLQNRLDDSVPVMRIESPESKLLMVAMRCQKMEQDNDMLRLRIEELEDTIAAITNKDGSMRGQYWIFQTETNNAIKPQETKISFQLAVDDLVSTNSL